MKTMNSVVETAKESYVVVVIAILGIAAFLSAVLIAYPALAYLGSKMFN
jgi:hypothetical protein